MIKAKKTKATRVKVTELIEEKQRLLKEDKGASPALKKVFSQTLTVLIGMSNQLGINSSNSSKPPSQDPNRPRKVRTARGRKRKPGGQKGHKGNYLKQVENPTSVAEIFVDQESLPHGKYKHKGFESRQVFDVEVSLTVTAYRAEVLVNEYGDEFVADFPEGVTEPAQYGNTIKAHSVYMSQFQLVPLDRVRDHFNDQLGIAVSKGSVSNWNVRAYKKLEPFEEWARRRWIGWGSCPTTKASLFMTTGNPTLSTRVSMPSVTRTIFGSWKPLSISNRCAGAFRRRYRKILKAADKECPRNQKVRAQ